jgi:glucose-6-phosphate 1-epimerase
MDLERRNDAHGIPGTLRFTDGPGGLPMAEVDNGAARARVSLHGGQVLSYRLAGARQDLLFLSPRAQYRDGKAIRGGIPVCWPWFGPDPEGRGRPSHGVARTRMWQVLETSGAPEESTRITLGLTPDDAVRALWEPAFELRLVVTVGAELALEPVTRNRGNEGFRVTQALHTYFLVGDVRCAEVLGLDGLEYLDKVEGGARRCQSGSVTIEGEVDRVYLGVGPRLTVRDPALGRQIRIESDGSATAVVWNPWERGAREMADLEDDDYRRMLCVETANAGEEVVEVPPGGQWTLSARYAVKAL